MYQKIRKWKNEDKVIEFCDSNTEDDIDSDDDTDSDDEDVEKEIKDS